MLTEFGGIAFSADARAKTWGYIRRRRPAEFARLVRALLGRRPHRRLFGGFCYTQFTDTYQEANGLLYMDRTPKIPLEQIAAGGQGQDRAWGALLGEHLAAIRPQGTASRA